MYYVYRFLDGLGDIIYVGRTKSGIKSRMRQHFSDAGHLPNECYNSVHLVEYIELKSQIDMYIKELYYIDKWKPVYNSTNKYEEDSDIRIEGDDKWVQYKSKKDIQIEELKETVDLLNDETKKLQNEIDLIGKKLSCEVEKTHDQYFLYGEKSNECISLQNKVKELEEIIDARNILSLKNDDGKTGKDEGFSQRECILMMEHHNISFSGELIAGEKTIASYLLYKTNDGIRVSIKKNNKNEDYLLDDVLNLKHEGQALFHYKDALNIDLIGDVLGFKIIESIDSKSAVKFIREYKTREENRKKEREKMDARYYAARKSLSEDAHSLYLKVVSNLSRDEYDNFRLYYDKKCMKKVNLLEAYNWFLKDVKRLDEAC